MTHAPCRHTDAIRLAILILLAPLALIALPSRASAQAVLNPRLVEFNPSVDHDETLPDGRSAVERYLFKVFQTGASQPFHTVDMGKPDPDGDGVVRFDFWNTVAAWPLPGGEYVSRVDAVGPGGSGLSAPSNTFAFGSSCSYSLLGPTSASFPAAGGGGSVSVDAGDECDWTATSEVAWIHLAASGGTGSGSIIFNVDPNPNTTPRSGTIDVAGSAFTVTQDAVACTYAVSPASASYGAPAGSGSFSVSSPAGCNWTASSNVGWITLGAVTAGSGNATVAYSVAANTGTAPRSAIVTAGGATFTVAQAAGAVACTYALSPASASFEAPTGTGSFAVSSPAGCGWTASSNADWLTLGTVRSGTGNATVTYSVTANSATSPRSGVVTVGGASHNVTQAGASSTPTAPPLPSPWQHGDIGAVGQAGAATATSGVFSVSGAGPGLAGVFDAFHFAYRGAAAEVVADVTSVSDGCPNGRAGVMLRENAGVSARFVAIVALPQGGFEVLHRVTPNSRTSVVARISEGALGYLRLVRNKRTITVYRSDNGTSWSQVARVSTKFTPTLGGLAVTSGSGTLLNGAAFDHVSTR